MREKVHPVAMLLLAALLVVAPVNGALAAGLAQPSHPAACHDPEPVNPSPASSTHQCCASGHDWAMASAGFSVHFVSALFVPDISIRITASHPDFSVAMALVFPSASPPGAIPLRV
jgi:hypothetical protein